MPPSSLASEPDTISPFEVYQALPRQSLFRRFLTTQRHLFGLVFGALSVDVANRKAAGTGRGPRLLPGASTQRVHHPFLDRSLRDLPFPVQLRRRLERLGPTYIKLGQILSLREDILPKSITQELKHLLSSLPAVPYPVLCELITKDLGRPLDEMFLSIDEIPLGSASIGQVHRATTHDGDAVIIKVVKPGIPAILRRDAKLLALAGWVLEIAFPRYRPEADHPGILRLHPARGGPAPRGRQRRDLRGQLCGRARYRVPQDLPGVQRRAGPDDGVLRRAATRLGAGPGDVVRGPRAAGRPRRGSHHPDDLQGRLLPRRPASRQPDRAPRAEGGVHRPRHGRPDARRTPPHPALLLLRPRHGRRRERRPLSRRRRRSRAVGATRRASDGTWPRSPAAGGATRTSTASPWVS